ncbi:hypothetical protein [Streptomyces sp. Ru87]|uniref:hypothetical protein n=1 Tax=Streptomyces sp. Ru87 TaxID=2044307 RepID=UPI000BFAA11A|nr:hypothetical protein [Streptomyces sp. Ru87]PGH49309.1 hypothetical protein CRI70_18380 [Streptomyces sp. Ru87]
MVVTISLVILFGAALAALLKFKTLGFGSAFVAVMFGFYLASSGAAEPVHKLTTAVVDAVRDL